MSKSFPKDFLFGVSTSAYQTEGGNFNNDWSFYERNKVSGSEFPLEICGSANDFWTRFKDDIDLVVELNSKAFRLGVEWSRIEPREGFFDEDVIFQYKEILHYAKSKKLKIFLTLHHFTNPLWLHEKGGFFSKKSSFFFSRYSLRCVSEFKDYVDYFITFNEPENMSYCGYVNGHWPPFEKNNYLKMILHLSSLQNAHIECYKKIKQNFGVKVGIVTNILNFCPQDKSVKTIFTSTLLKNISEKITLWKVRKHIDFIGLNFYFCFQVKGFEITNNVDPKSDMGWLLDPESIRTVLKSLKKYRRDIFITENGLADETDSKRSWYLKSVLLNVLNSIYIDKVRVKGYFHWTLADNFEWEYGYKYKFGLVEIIRNENLKRIKRKSFDTYRLICLTHKIYE